MAEPGPSELASASPDNAPANDSAPVQEQLQPAAQAPQTPRNPASGYESGVEVLSGSESDGANPVPNGDNKVSGDPQQRVKKSKKKKKQKKINREHPEFELTYDMMLGIRTTVSQAEAKPLRELHHSDFTDSLKLQFKSEGTSTTPAHQMRDFKFKDYAPEVSRRLRTRFGIKAADYLLCVCGNFQYLEFISNSKSGQFFFYTHNRQFMIKTVSKDESKFLRKILPHYYHHVMSNPNTLLTRFYGMHRVKPHKKKEVHFLIFASVFYNSKFIHVTFDIKGSTLNRNATENDKQEAACVYKDNDFLEKKMKIKLGPARVKLLQEQIDKDVEFLRQLSIMDYSLLLGIHYGDRPVVKGRNRSVSEAGGATGPASGDEAEDDEDSEYDPVAKVRRPSKRPSFVITGTGAIPAGPSNPASAVSVAPAEPPASDGDTLGPLVTVAAPMDEKAPPADGGDDNPQTHYGLPANYTKFSKPEDIHFVAPEFAPVNVPERKEESANKTQIKVVQSIFTADDGGVRAVDANGNPLQEWYYFGIIDILTLYGMRKRVEHFGKALKYKSDTISAVNPKFYAKRFKTFLSDALQ